MTDTTIEAMTNEDQKPLLTLRRSRATENETRNDYCSRQRLAELLETLNREMTAVFITMETVNEPMYGHKGKHLAKGLLACGNRLRDARDRILHFLNTTPDWEDME